MSDCLSVDPNPALRGGVMRVFWSCQFPVTISVTFGPDGPTVEFTLNNPGEPSFDVDVPDGAVSATVHVVSGAYQPDLIVAVK